MWGQTTTLKEFWEDYQNFQNRNYIDTNIADFIYQQVESNSLSDELKDKLLLAMCLVTRNYIDNQDYYDEMIEELSDETRYGE